MNHTKLLFLACALAAAPHALLPADVSDPEGAGWHRARTRSARRRFGVTYAAATAHGVGEASSVHAARDTDFDSQIREFIKKKDAMLASNDAQADDPEDTLEVIDPATVPAPQRTSYADVVAQLATAKSMLSSFQTSASLLLPALGTTSRKTAASRAALHASAALLRKALGVTGKGPTVLQEHLKQASTAQAALQDYRAQVMEKIQRDTVRTARAHYLLVINEINTLTLSHALKLQTDAAIADLASTIAALRVAADRHPDAPYSTWIVGH